VCLPGIAENNISTRVYQLKSAEKSLRSKKPFGKTNQNFVNLVVKTVHIKADWFFKTKGFLLALHRDSQGNVANVKRKHTLDKMT